jgi:hypothetical protein
MCRRQGVGQQQWVFQVYGTVGGKGGFGTESEVNLIRMIRGWVGFEAYE